MTTVQDVIMAVAARTGVPWIEFFGRRWGGRAYSDARALVYLICTRDLKVSNSEVGRILHKDHTTVLYGVKSIQHRLGMREDLQDALCLVRLDLGLPDDTPFVRRVAPDNLLIALSEIAA